MKPELNDKCWDRSGEDSKSVDIPVGMTEFMLEIAEVCKKHNLSIAHEDGHGCFIIEKYNDDNIQSLFNAFKEYEVKS